MRIRVLKLKNAILTVSTIAIIIVLAVLLHVTGSYRTVFVTKRQLPIYSVARDDKKISISFDCAWGVEHTDEILSVLKREQVNATFFMVEFWAKKYPEYVKKIDAAGHEIGTHSRTHSKMSTLSKASIVDELKTSSEAITNSTGKKVELFRPPFGDYNNTLIETAKDEGYFTIQWDVDSLDWKDLSAMQITNRILKSVKSGSIILCHNNAKYIADALPILLDRLKNQGYTFVPIGQLIFRENFIIDTNGVQKNAL